jgi:predicted metal-dependent hydrolase
MSPTRLRLRTPQTVVLPGEGAIQVKVRESPGARTARLRVGPQHPIEIIVPRSMTDAEVATVLADRRDWIAGKLDASRAVAGRALLGLDRPRVVWLAGRSIEVQPDGSRPIARLRDETLRVGGTGPEAARAVERWYRRRAREEICRIAEEEAGRLGVDYRSVIIRDQRTRWGSCSPSGNLGFNWRLVMAPEEVLRYVVVHELCHRQVANHSKRFWQLLEESAPGWRAPAAWLRQHGGELRGYRVSL